MLAITLVACTGTNDDTRSPTETGDREPATDPSAVVLDSDGFNVGPFEDGEPIVVVGTDSDIAYFIAAVGHDRGYLPSDESYSLDTMTGEWTEISPPPIEHALVRGVGVSTYDTLVVIGEDCEPGAGELYLCDDGRPKKVVGFAYDRADDKWTRFDIPSDDVRGYRGLPTPATGVPGDAEVMYWRFGDFGGRLSMIFELDIRTLEWRQRDDIYVGIGMCAVGDTLYGLEPGLLPRLVTARPGAEIAIEEVPGLTADASESPPLRPFCTSTHLTIGQASDHEESGAPQLTRPLDGDTWRCQTHRAEAVACGG